MEISTDTVCRIKSGDRDAFRDMYLVYYPKVRSFIIRRSNCRSHLAEEITQEVFFRLWVNRGSLDGYASFDSYLYTIAKNITTDMHRKNLIAAGYLNRMQSETTAPGNDETTLSLNYSEMQRLIDTAIDRMPPKQREVFRLSRTDELLNEEIACRLGISKRTVEKHISNSLKTIRAVVKNNFILLLV